MAGREQPVVLIPYRIVYPLARPPPALSVGHPPDYSQNFSAYQTVGLIIATNGELPLKN